MNSWKKATCRSRKKANDSQMGRSAKFIIRISEGKTRDLVPKRNGSGAAAEQEQGGDEAEQEPELLSHRVVRVDAEGRALLQELQSRKERSGGDHWLDDAPGVSAGDRRAPPSEEWKRQAKALQRYQLLFTDEGGGLGKAMALVEDPLLTEPFAVGPWDRYTPFAQMVLGAGHDFAVSEDGRVTIQEVEEADHSFDATEIPRRARAIGWEDKELLGALEWGARDHSGSTPRVCIFARALKGAVAHADVLERKVEEEVAKGSVGRREAHPYGVPAVGRRTNVIPKGEAVEGQEQRWRCLVDRSDGKTVFVADGERSVPATPNTNTEKLELPRFRWASIQAVMEGGTIVADAAKRTGGVVEGGT
jgi:hypothetical protein